MLVNDLLVTVFKCCGRQQPTLRQELVVIRLSGISLCGRLPKLKLIGIRLSGISLCGRPPQLKLAIEVHDLKLSIHLSKHPLKMAEISTLIQLHALIFI